jgi:hypothetical protein
MRFDENVGGGDTVVVEPGDDLTDVPPSHLDLITPQIRKAFADPVQCFRDIAGRSQFRELSRWLNALIEDGAWELELNRGALEDERRSWTMTGFRWMTRSVHDAVVGLPSPPGANSFPNTLADYYELVGFVHWSVFGGAGGLDGADSHTPITEWPHYANLQDNPHELFAWGWGYGGDMLVYSTRDRGGWLGHETGAIHWLGSIEDAINWVFAELSAAKAPDYDYRWLKSG